MYLSSGLSFCRMRRTSCTMGGFCLLYLLMILLMRSGDVETNPGPDRIVTEEEFIKLCKVIEPSYYKKVGFNLGISNAQLGQIIVQHMLNTSDALMTVFTRWRDKRPPGADIRALLAEELERSDLGSLSGELLAGSLVSKRTGASVTMPGSQTQPLSPDLIKRCADDFKSKYRTTLCKIRADPLNPDSIVQFPDMYTYLVLTEEYRQHKRPLEYRDLFYLKVNGEFPKRIMVEGEAGTGKTTFCAKIAWDWINDIPAVSKFVWVLVVPLHEAKQYTIGEIAKSYLSKDNPATAYQITEYIRANPKDVFIAFDGLDEFDGKVVLQRKSGSKPKSSSPASVTLQPKVNISEASGSSSERGEIALRDILCSDELAACPVLVTSRPWKVLEIRWDISLRKQYTFIHVEGFSKENVEVYIHKYFQDDGASADQLIRLTRDNEIISKNMAPYPIYIAMLCLMWRELGDEKQEKSFQTFSQIFDEMFEFLKVHYTQKAITDLDSPSFQAYRSRLEKLMEPVAKAAFIGLQEDTLIFNEVVFEQCSDSMETACRVGVLSQETKLSSIFDKSSMFLQSSFFFPHKFFQEYMAGIHLASLYESDPNEFNRLIEKVVLPRKEEFRHLLYFTVSRDRTIANHVMKCMVQALQGNTPNPKEMDFLVDVAFESQDLDTAALVRGGMSSLRIDPSMTAHTIAGYVFTGLGVHTCTDVIDPGKFGPNISHGLAEIICSVPALKDVALIHASFHSDFYAVLAKEGNKSKVQTFMLEDVRCPTQASSHHLVEALCSMPNLTDLRVSGSDFQEEFYSTLNAQASTLKIEKLCINDCDLKENDPTASHDLAKFICLLPCLTNLTMRDSDYLWLHDDFYHELARLASFSKQIEKLCIGDCNLKENDPTASRDLARFICLLPCLTDLTMSGSDHLWLHNDFYHELALLASSSKIEKLCIDDCDLKENDRTASRDLAKFICLLPCLTDLMMRDSGHLWLSDAFYHEFARLASSSKNHFFNKKLHWDERSEELRQMDVGQQREYIRHLLHPTLSEITPRPTSKALQGFVQHSSQKAGIVEESVQHSGQKAGIVAETDKNGSSANGIFGALGGELSSKSHGFTLHIPPGALEEDQKISLGVLTEIPNGLTLKDDEVLVSHGYQCYPSGLHFKKPAKLIIPHCAIVTAPNKIQTVLYSWNQSGTPKRLLHSSDIICSVQERWLEVSISRFSGGYFALIWDLLFLKGILLSCMSFLPRVLPYNRQPVMEVHFVKMLHDKNWNDAHALTGSNFSHPVKDEDDYVVFRRSTLTVSCQLGETSPETDSHQAIQYSDLSSKTKEIKYFPLNLTERSDETLVTLSVVQTTTQTIKFNTHFQGITESPKPAASTSVDIAPQNESAAAGEVSTFRDRALSVNEQHEHEDKYHSEGIFDKTGGELHIPSYGLTLSIPPGALPEGSVETITLDVLTDVPPEFTLRDDETLVTYGFRCLPSGIHFVSGKPVKLKIPHCANLIDPNKVQVVMYSMNHEGEVDRIVQTSRTCRVTYTHVEILLEHFTNRFLTFIRDLFSMRDKRMSFMPFLPKIMPQSREMILEFCMVNKPNGNSWKDVHEIGEEAEYRPAKDRDDEMNVKYEDMEVTCQLSDNDTIKVIVDESVIRKIRHTFYFELDFKERADDLLVKLKVKQSMLPLDIMFRTHRFASRGITETSPGKTDFASPRLSALTSVDIPPKGATAAAGEVYTPKARPTGISREHDFDDLLTTVASQFHKNTDINSLGKELGFDTTAIARYIQTNERYSSVSYSGTLDMLRDWRKSTTILEEREQLKKALIAIDHHHLADELLNDDMASKYEPGN